MHAWAVVAGEHPGVCGEREHHPGRLRPRSCCHDAGSGAWLADTTGAGERGQDGFGDGLVVAVPVRVGGDFDGLGGFALVHLSPPGNVQQASGARVVGSGGAAEERPRLVDGVHQLSDRAPPRLRPHLEQTQGVVVGAVTVVRIVAGLRVGAGVGEHPQRGLGERRHERDHQPVTGDPVDLTAGLDDRRGVGELGPVQRERLTVRRRHGQLVGDIADGQAQAGDGAGGGRGQSWVHHHPDPD